MGNSSCGGNTYEAIKRSIYQEKCINGPYMMVGMKHATGQKPPIWLFGERHESPKYGKCPLLSNILRNGLSCDNRCGNRMVFYPELSFDHFEDYNTDRNWNYERGSAYSFDVGRYLVDLMLEVPGVCWSNGSVQAPDTLWRHRGIMYAKDEEQLTKRFNGLETALNDLFPNEPKHPPIARTLKPIDMMELVGMWLDSIIKNNYSVDIQKIADRLMHRARNGSGDVSSTLQHTAHQIGYMVSVFGDIYVVEHMVKNAIGASVIVSYWGSSHLEHQIEYLKAYGYEIDVNLTNTNEGVSNITIGAQESRHRMAMDLG